MRAVTLDGYDEKRALPGILVVEDEESLRRLCERLLERAGYRVYLAEDGSEGLRILGKLEGDIRVVYSDISMPGMGGFEFADIVNRKYPGINIVLVSGHYEEEFEKELDGKGFRFLGKPFKTADLLSLLEELVAGS